MGSTSYTGNMFSLRLGLFLCIFYIIGMEAAPEPRPEDLHIHLNLHDQTAAAQEGGGVAGDYAHAMWDNIKGLKGSDVCPPGTVLHSLQGRCIRLKGRREALDAPITHKTKRGFEFQGESSRKNRGKKKKGCRKNFKVYKTGQSFFLIEDMKNQRHAV